MTYSSVRLNFGEMSKGRNGKFCLKLQIINATKTELIFVDPAVMVSGQYYCDVLLSQQMLPAIKGVAGNTFVFHKTALRHIAPATPFSCCSGRHPTFHSFFHLRKHFDITQ